MTKKSGETGEPCGNPTETGTGRVMDRPDKKDPAQETR